MVPYIFWNNSLRTNHSYFILFRDSQSNKLTLSWIRSEKRNRILWPFFNYNVHSTLPVNLPVKTLYPMVDWWTSRKLNPPFSSYSWVFFNMDESSHLTPICKGLSFRSTSQYCSIFSETRPVLPWPILILTPSTINSRSVCIPNGRTVVEVHQRISHNCLFENCLI